MKSRVLVGIAATLEKTATGTDTYLHVPAPHCLPWRRPRCSTTHNTFFITLSISVSQHIHHTDSLFPIINTDLFATHFVYWLYPMHSRLDIEPKGYPRHFQINNSTTFNSCSHVIFKKKRCLGRWVGLELTISGIQGLIKTDKNYSVKNISKYNSLNTKDRLFFCFYHKE